MCEQCLIFMFPLFSDSFSIISFIFYYFLPFLAAVYNMPTARCDPQMLFNSI